MTKDTPNAEEIPRVLGALCQEGRGQGRDRVFYCTTLVSPDGTEISSTQHVGYCVPYEALTTNIHRVSIM